MKRERQVTESKEMIANAMVTLLKEHPYEVLTLSEIADHAGFTRMTLYRHFKTKDRIILYCAQRTLERHQDQARDRTEPVRELIYRQLEWMRTLPQLPILLQSKEIEELLDGVRTAAHREGLEQALGVSFEEEPSLFHFYFGGVNRVVLRWLEQGCPESTQSLTDRIVAMTRSFVLANRREERTQQPQTRGVNV